MPREKRLTVAPARHQDYSDSDEDSEEETMIVRSPVKKARRNDISPYIDNNESSIMTPVIQTSIAPPPLPPPQVMLQRSSALLPEQEPTQSYPCGTCQNEVNDNDDAIFCESGCSRWYHRICAGLTETAYDLLTNEENADWVCDHCITHSNIPLVKLKS